VLTPVEQLVAVRGTVKVIAGSSVFDQLTLR
jgi:hypothetical protein